MGLLTGKFCPILTELSACDAVMAGYHSLTFFFFVFFFQPKSADFFLISPQKTYVVGTCYCGASNEYPQHMFSWRNKKNIMWQP